MSKHSGRRRPRAGSRPSEKTSQSPQASGPALRRDRRQIWGVGLLILGAVVFLQHLVSHMGFYTVLPGSLDDLLIGYPTAGVLVLAGLLLVSDDEKKRKK